MTTETAYAILFSQQSFETVVDWLSRLRVAPRHCADVAQEVLMSAWASFHRYDPARARPERWLNGITVHVAARHNGRAHHRRERLAPMEALDAPDERPRADERIAAEQDRLLFLRALDTIDIHQRGILIAHDIDGVPMAEVAARHGLVLSTAYKRRVRAMVNARAAIEGLDEARGQ